MAGPLIFDRGLWVIAGIGIAGAAEDALKPILEPARQNSWAHRPWKVLDPSLAAAARARNEQLDYGGIDRRGVDLMDDMQRNGIGTARAEILSDLNRTWPAVAELLDLRRRRLAFGGTSGITQADFRDGLRRQGYTKESIDALTDLLVAHLDVADIANAIQQGFIPNDGILAAASAPNPDWVRADGPIGVPVEQVQIDPKNEAAYHGLDEAHLKVLAELVGLPPGEETLLDLWRRGAISAQTYADGLREAHTKTKWTEALSARFYQLLPPSVLVNLRIRGWITDTDYHDRMRLHGFRPEQAQDWFDSIGRPATTHQAYIGVTRGGSYDGSTAGIPDYFKKAVLQSNIRPEWTNILWAGHYSLPSAFVLRALLQGGAITATEGQMYFEHSGWPPDLAKKVAEHYGATTAAATDPHVARAETQLWSSTHKSYLNEEAADAVVTARFDLLNIDTAAQTRILELWQAERSLIRKTLTPAQLKKAFRGAVVDPQTGAPYTREEIIARLLALGYDEDDANTFLDE